eukprot:sb/3464632/
MVKIILTAGIHGYNHSDCSNNLSPLSLVKVTISLYPAMTDGGMVDIRNFQICRECASLGAISTCGAQLSLFAMVTLAVTRAIKIVRGSLMKPAPATRRDCANFAVLLVIIGGISVTIATTPLLPLPGFQDFFVNGQYYNPQLRLFAGLVNKETHYRTLEKYYGRSKRQVLSWARISNLVNNMFSHDYIPEIQSRQVHFYGNAGVCLFKYFVTPTDPQRTFVWSVLAINTTCFFAICMSYVAIATIERQSSRALVGEVQEFFRNVSEYKNISFPLIFRLVLVAGTLYLVSHLSAECRMALSWPLARGRQSGMLILLRRHKTVLEAYTHPGAPHIDCYSFLTVVIRHNCHVSTWVSTRISTWKNRRSVNERLLTTVLCAAHWHVHLGPASRNPRRNPRRDMTIMSDDHFDRKVMSCSGGGILRVPTPRSLGGVENARARDLQRMCGNNFVF